MKSIDESELVRNIVPDRTQIEVYEKDGEHFCGPIKQVEDDGAFLVFHLLWRGDYDHNSDKWFGAREVRPLKIPKNPIRIVRDEEKIFIEWASRRMSIILHPSEAPLLKRSDVENLDIINPNLAAGVED